MLRRALLSRCARSLGRRSTGSASRSLRFAVLLAVLALSTAAVTPAFANDLSDFPCTAGDVEIVGNGIIINEPCLIQAGGLFNATVQFSVRNSTSTPRYCIALHLVPDGAVISAPIDIILRDGTGSSNAPGKSGNQKYRDTIMYGTLVNYPASAGVVCFGEAGVVRGKCAPNTCTTISWNTSPGASGCTTADQSPPGGQCRHQQVCIVGYGATLACVSNCTVTCGGSSTLQACVQGPASRGPYTFALAGSDGSSQSQSAFADASGTTCLNFNVNPTRGPVTTYTLTVTDKGGCTRTAIASVNVNVATAAITAPSSPACNGVLVYAASVSGFTGCSYVWTVDGQALATFAAGGDADDARVARVSGSAGETFSFRALDNACHKVEVTASCANGTQNPCQAKASVTAKECASPTLGCQQ